MSEAVRENSRAGSHPAQSAAVNATRHLLIDLRRFQDGGELPRELRQKAVSG
jgi:hypothetical protein